MILHSAFLRCNGTTLFFNFGGVNDDKMKFENKRQEKN